MRVGKAPEFDYDNLKGEKFYDATVFYSNSKLANMWFTYELQRRLAGTGVTSNAVCPGFVPEAIGDRRTSPFDRLLYRQVLPRMPFARSLDQASASYLFAATDPQLGGCRRQVHHRWQRAPLERRVLRRSEGAASLGRELGLV